MPSASYSRLAGEDGAASDDDERWPVLEANAAAALGTLQPPFTAAVVAASAPSLASRLLFSWARPVIDAVPPGTTAAADATADDISQDLHPAMASARQATLLGEHRRVAPERLLGEQHLLGESSSLVDKTSLVR